LKISGYCIQCVSAKELKEIYRPEENSRRKQAYSKKKRGRKKGLKKKITKLLIKKNKVVYKKKAKICY